MFMSAISINPRGVIEGDPLIARAVAKLLKRADELIVLADSSKFAIAAASSSARSNARRPGGHRYRRAGPGARKCCARLASRRWSSTR
jgi:hypothetical protein